MNKVFLVYTTDLFNHRSSRKLIGVCTTGESCIEVICEDINKKRSDELSEENKRQLQNYGKTQFRKENYDIDELETDKLI